MEYFFVYILRCSDGTYYVGQTDDIEKRIAAHRSKAYSCYTAKRLPIEVVFCQQCFSRTDAFTLEKKIKSWSRKKKEALISGDWESVKLFAKKKFG